MCRRAALPARASGAEFEANVLLLHGTIVGVVPTLGLNGTSLNCNLIRLEVCFRVGLRPLALVSMSEGLRYLRASPYPPLYLVWLLLGMAQPRP